MNYCVRICRIKNGLDLVKLDQNDVLCCLHNAILTQNDVVLNWPN